MDENKNIDDNNNDEAKDDDKLDIDADTETMNNQLHEGMKKVNKNVDGDEPPKKEIRVDRDMVRTLITEWLALDDQIKFCKETIKDKGDEKKQYEDKILELMDVLHQDVIITKKGNISKNVKQSKSPLTSDLIKATLFDILKDQGTAEEYTNRIIERRTMKENVSLKREKFEVKKKVPEDKKKKI
jgi:hypothetical protein